MTTPIAEDRYYEVWVEANGRKSPTGHGPDARYGNAVAVADQYNADEARRAHEELRPIVSRYFVVRAVVTYIEETTMETAATG